MAHEGGPTVTGSANVNVDGSGVSGSFSAGVSYGAGNLTDPWAASNRNLYAQQFAAGRTIDHYGLFNFRVEIEGLDAGGFKQVEGLEVSIEPIIYHQGNRRMPLKRPGRPTVGNIKLIKGYVASDTLWRWCQQVCDGVVRRKSGSVVLLADDGMREICRYNFFNAWPTRWSGFRMDGKGTDVMVEELELAVESVKRA